jgi:hypothetical protein
VNLLFTKLLSGVVLVQAGEVSVVSLIQCLVLLGGDALLIDLLELDSQGVLGTLKSRGESEIEAGLKARQ